MNLKELRARGAFIQAPPVPVEVEWTHFDDEKKEEMTDKFTVYVKRMSVGWLDRVFIVDPKDKKRSRTAALIAEGISLGENGEQNMTYKEAYTLDFGLAAALLKAFNSVNRRAGDTDDDGDDDANGEDKEEVVTKN